MSFLDVFAAFLGLGGVVYFMTRQAMQDHDKTRKKHKR